MRLSNADRKRVEEAVRAAEARTDGEICVVVAAESDDYRALAALWAVLAALLLGPVLLLFDVPPAPLVVTQLLAAAVLGALSQWERVRFSLAPREVKRHRAHRTAVDIFLAHDIHTTPGRTGLLLFVSLAERHAEVVADTAIFHEVADEVWVELIERLTARIGDGRLGAGLVEAVETAGDILAAHFPPTDASDRLPNAVVEI